MSLERSKALVYIKKNISFIYLLELSAHNFVDSNLPNRQIFFRQISSTNLRSTFFVVDKIDVSRSHFVLKRVIVTSY